MSYLTCPNCGSSMTIAGHSSTAPPCPDCCARLSASDVVGRQRAQSGAAQSRRRVRLVLVPDITAPASARRALDCLQTDIDPDALERARLVVSEFVTNAVTHAAPEDGA